MSRPRPSRWQSLSFLLLASTAFATGEEPPPVAPPFVLPPVHYSTPHSFRGVQPGGRIPNFGISGHASGLPGVHDYLRLVPPTPLAFGGIFTQEPLLSEEWVAEIAFRVHGPTAGVLVEPTSDENKPRRIPKGGRGLAFWFSKTANPTAITISSQPNTAVSAPPPGVPEFPTDPNDPLVSLFGYKTTFDGLGIIFDTSPTTPLYPRADSRNWGDDLPGVGTSGVVSGLLDDGTGEGKWLEANKRVLKDGEEAAYLDKAVGECEAAFRNAQGLLWARISYIESTIRVDLDLQPHTTLSKAGRDYAHNCFTLPGIKLTPGAYLGLTGLASGSAEPDAVDVYAMDVFEVVKVAEGQRPPTSTDEPPEVVASEAAPLEGTTDDASVSLAHEIFLSQARMVEAIDALSRRVEGLARSISTSLRAQRDGSPGGGSAGIASPLIVNRLTSIEARLSELLSAPKSPVPPPSLNYDQTSEKDSVKHILQLQDRLMVELKAFGRKLDTGIGQQSASLSTLSSRTAETLQLLNRVSSGVEETNAKGQGWISYVLLGGSIVVLFVGWWKARDGFGVGGGWGRGKKMI